MTKPQQFTDKSASRSPRGIPLFLAPFNFQEPRQVHAVRRVLLHAEHRRAPRQLLHGNQPAAQREISDLLTSPEGDLYSKLKDAILSRD